MDLDVHGDAITGILSAGQVDLKLWWSCCWEYKGNWYFYLRGVTNIGVGGTTLTGITTNSRIGINSTAPNYNLDVGGITMTNGCKNQWFKCSWWGNRNGNRSRIIKKHGKYL